ncbi:MAG TPA: hypothetical protein VI136_07860 [Verrucomicrobiae bacterium]
MSLLDALLLDPHRINVWIAYRTDGVKGSGTQSDPYDGHTAALFDARMSELATNTCVHLGPGTFQTAGYADGLAAWQAKSGLKLVGSGIDVTTLQLANGTGSSYRFYVVGHALTSTPVDFVEVSDLTVDCNLGSLNGATSTAGAVRLMGNHCRVVRVKVKNWGNMSTGTEGFVIAMLTGDPSQGVNGVTNCGVEECIAVDPHGSAAGKVTVLHCGGKEDATSATEAFGLGPYIRNCFVDCGQTTDFSKEFRGLSMAWCKGGVVEGNQVHNTKFGGPYQAATGARDLVVRNNVYRNVFRGPYWNVDSQGVQQLLVEGNSVDLAAGAGGTDYAIELKASGTPYVHGNVLIRDNRIRYVDGGSGSANGIRVQNAHSLFVRENVLDVAPAQPEDPLSNQDCESAAYFGNKTPGGVLLQGYNENNSKRYDELETEAEDALVLALFNRR